MSYDGFISYSHSADDLLAPRLQSGLQRFAKPWWKRRAIRVFRDESSLSANPHLWSSITDALDASAWFILLLSPDAAASPWVNDEVTYWLANKPVDRILPVVTEGEFGPDILPPALTFDDEPRWVDLRFARTETQLDLKNPTFSAAIADIASAVRGIPKDELESEEVRQHRRTIRTAWAAGIIVLLLAIAASVLGVIANQNADEAAVSATLAAESAANALSAQQDAEAARDEAQSERAVAEEERVNARNSEHEARAAQENAVQRELLARSRELAANSAIVLGEDAELAMLLALVGTSLVEDPPRELVESLHRAVLTSRIVERQERISIEQHLSGATAGVLIGDTIAESAGRGAYLRPTSSDGGLANPELVVVDLESGDELWAVGLDGEVETYALAPNGEYVTTVTAGPGYIFGDPIEFVVRDGDTGDVIATFDEIQDGVQPIVAEVSHSPDGRYLILSAGLRGVGLVDTGTMSLVDLGIRHDEGLLVAVAFDPDSDLVAISTLDEITVFDSIGRVPVSQFKVDADVWALAMFDGVVFTGDDAGAIVAWDGISGTLLFEVGSHPAPIDGFRVTSGDRLLAWDSADTVATWNTSEAGFGETATYGAGVADTVRLSSDTAGHRIITIPYNNGPFEDSTRVYDTSTGDWIAEDPTSIGLGGTMSADGRYFATQRNIRTPDGVEVGPVVIVDVVSGAVVELAGSDRTGFQAIAFSSDGSLVAGGDTRGLTSVWHASTGELLRHVSQVEQFVTGVGFMADDQIVVIADGEGTIDLRNLATGDSVSSVVHGEHAFITELTVSPSQDLLVSLGLDNTARVWSVSEPSAPVEVARLSGHFGVPNDSDFNMDGSLLATISSDSTVRVWETMTWEEVTRVGLPGPGTSVVLLGQGETAVVAIDGGSVIGITLNPSQLVGLAEDRVTRSLTSAECTRYRVDPCPTLEEIKGSR